MDTEGAPIQELAALAVNTETREIVDAFLGYAMTEESDLYSRNHIHGLDLTFLKREGFHSEDDLIMAFKDWLAPKLYIKIISNGSHKESKALNLAVENFPLLPWNERGKEISHQLALRFKKLSMSIMGRKCSPAAHSSYVCTLHCKNPTAFETKSEHKYHCAFYDSYELYLHYMFYESY